MSYGDGMPNPASLVIDELSHNYGRVQALKGVSFEVVPGEVFGLLGPNGAGKTSIISSIVGLVTPNCGTISLSGIPLNAGEREAKHLIGYVPQDIINHGFFSVEEILITQRLLYGLPRDKKWEEILLQRLHLGNKRHALVSQLSGGMKRRLLIAKGLIHRPKLLLLDEPSAGVDQELRLALWDLIRELRNDQLSILLTTHYLEEAEVLCDRIAILKEGSIECIDTTQGLIATYAKKRLYLTLNEKTPLPPHPYILTQHGLEVVVQTPTTLSLDHILREIQLSPMRLANLVVKEGSLEQVMEEVI
ncbi:MAG: ABC transporter ATP-binding protein [Chlamydiota bacterium]|nr:ABC transporter ATP-binding protein [Chlamydiota bacterium]